MKEKIEIRSSLEGFISQIFWSGIFFTLLALLARKMDFMRDTISRYDLPWPSVVMYFSYFLMMYILIGNLSDILYTTSDTHVFQRLEDNPRKTLTSTTYGFPFSKSYDTKIFDCILPIEIRQPSISRLLNTGTLTICLIIFTSSSYKKTTITIDAVRNPLLAKEKLEAMFLIKDEFVSRIKIN